MWLPGTHDTMADCGGDLAECQSWTLMEQLKSGIRAFDIRLKHESDELPCYHGIIYLQKDVKAVVADIETFLKDHPKEALFMRVKKEGENGTHSCEFHDLFAKFLTKKELWDFGKAAFQELGSHRGKVMLMGFGSNLKLPKTIIDVQDKYDTGDAEVKFKAIIEHATKQRPTGTMNVSFCSCVGMDGSICHKAPGSIAYEINKKVLDAKKQLKPGIYLFDFPGKQLVKDIIGLHKP
jgi:1-phosphatidylinositol phosphodiesterase